MPLIAIPNVSEGRDPRFLQRCRGVIEAAGSCVLDLHTDSRHNRSVLTCLGDRANLVDAMAALAEVCRTIDLRTHTGVHPRVGGLDVCPFVPNEVPMSEAVGAAHEAGRAIARRAGTPVYFYEFAALRDETRSLVDLRRGGLAGLVGRAGGGLTPDEGGPNIEEARGVVCVGARNILIAFNVWVRCDLSVARAVASEVRETLRGVRSLGLLLEDPYLCQVSMNLIDPDLTGIDAAFEAVAGRARAYGADVRATEIVGLVARRHLPNPDAEAARLLMGPGRSLEDAIAGSSC